MKTKELIKMLQSVDGDIPVVIRIMLEEPFLAKTNITVPPTGEVMEILFHSSTARVLRQDVRWLARKGTRDIELEIRTYLPARGRAEMDSSLDLRPIR